MYNAMKKILKKQTEEGYLVVNIETENNYFSITGEIWKNKKSYYDNYDRNLMTCGCIHDEILEHFPELKIIVDLHLSDIDGLPMHAIENGFYYYEIMNGTARYHHAEPGDAEKYRRVLCEHLRITEKELSFILISLHDSDTTKGKKIIFSNHVNKLLPKWKDEADRALKYIEELP